MYGSIILVTYNQAQHLRDHLIMKNCPCGMSSMCSKWSMDEGPLIIVISVWIKTSTHPVPPSQGLFKMNCPCSFCYSTDNIQKFPFSSEYCYFIYRFRYFQIRCISQNNREKLGYTVNMSLMTARAHQWKRWEQTNRLFSEPPLLPRRDCYMVDSNELNDIYLYHARLKILHKYVLNHKCNWAHNYYLSKLLT